MVDNKQGFGMDYLASDCKGNVKIDFGYNITTYLQGNNKPFIDAFCGSCNIISKIDDKRIRIANDKHKELMAMWQWVQEHGVDRLPTDVSKELYYYIKTSTTCPDWLKGFVGFGCSFAGKWWGGYGGAGYCAAENVGSGI